MTFLRAVASALDPYPRPAEPDQLLGESAAREHAGQLAEIALRRQELRRARFDVGADDPGGLDPVVFGPPR